MVFAGVMVTLIGFLLSVASVAISSSTGGRMILVLAGIAISLFGIMGLINKAYLKDAIWRK